MVPREAPGGVSWSPGRCEVFPGGEKLVPRGVRDGYRRGVVDPQGFLALAPRSWFESPAGVPKRRVLLLVSGDRGVRRLRRLVCVLEWRASEVPCGGSVLGRSCGAVDAGTLRERCGGPGLYRSHRLSYQWYSARVATNYTVPLSTRPCWRYKMSERRPVALALGGGGGGGGRVAGRPPTGQELDFCTTVKRGGSCEATGTVGLWVLVRRTYFEGLLF